MQTWYDISKMVKIEVKLLLNANNKSYMLRRLAQQPITLSDRFTIVVAELVVRRIR